jgi:hypothetical protein
MRELQQQYALLQEQLPPHVHQQELRQHFSQHELQLRLDAQMQLDARRRALQEAAEASVECTLSGLCELVLVAQKMRERTPISAVGIGGVGDDGGVKSPSVPLFSPAYIVEAAAVGHVCFV